MRHEASCCTLQALRVERRRRRRRYTAAAAASRRVAAARVESQTPAIDTSFGAPNNFCIMVVDWLCPGLRPSANRRPRLLHCKVILLDEHELLQDILVSS
uniref:Uncharacterized protein n=1 Tax=Trichogramma kaykai TaxID=54128 RepID=A0ABD2VY26_9HYME